MSEPLSERRAGHTPGPWHVERRWSNGCEIVPRITCAKDDDRGCGWIADCIGAPYIGHESTLPNAYLIAAAPDLLAACEAALKDFDEIVNATMVPRLKVHPFTIVPAMLRAAIARAKEPTNG